MRAVALLCLLTLAAGEDLEVLTEPEWEARCRAIIGKDQNEFAKVEELKATAAKVAIRHEAKVLRVVPNDGLRAAALKLEREVTAEPKDFPAIVSCVEIPPAGSRRGTTTHGWDAARTWDIPVPAAEAETVKAWRRWDRLRWTTRPVVRTVWGWRAPDVPQSTADVTRTPAPVSPWPTYQSAGKMDAWLERYWASCKRGEWDTALAALKGLEGKALEVAATVQKPNTGAPSFVGCNEILSDLT